MIQSPIRPLIDSPRAGKTGPFRSIALLVFVLLLATPSAHAASAYSYWLKLREAILFNRANVPLPPGAINVTVGGEKEGGGSLLTRVMGPNRRAFRAYIARLNPADRAAFLQQFLRGMANGRYLVANVHDKDGRAVRSDVSMLNARALEGASLATLEASFNAWLNTAGDRSFSFITPEARGRIFRGSLIPGRAIEPVAEQKFIAEQRVFEDWVPLYGDPERNIDNASTQVSNTGWEIGFKPMANVIEYEQMVKWFRESLEDDRGLYAAPGHTRVVFKVGDNFDEDGLGEALRVLQGYYVIRGFAGKMMMERSLTEDKAVHDDNTLYELESERGIVRLESERFGAGTLAIEFRVGMNDEEMRQLVLPLMISMISTNDFKHMKGISDWDLVTPNALENLRPEELVQRFGVARASAATCLERLRAARIMHNEEERIIHPNYWAPFWKWENAPFLGARKKALLKSLGRAFIESVARWNNPTYADFQDAFQIWARSSRLTGDLLHYLEPKRAKSGLTEVKRLLRYPGPAGRVDLGIERTARMPVAAQTVRSPVAGGGGQAAWMGTLFDVTPNERREILHDTAARLALELGAPQEPELVADTLSAENTSHGHGISLLYSIRDAQDRKWRVEWDGISRNYDADGNLIPSSVRGGHVEIVSPKSLPKAEELIAEDAAFADQGLVPDPQFGGGHVNQDLEPFSARAIARELKVFHKFRRIITLLFQDVNRQRSAEAVVLSPKLRGTLNNFNGGDESLKRQLYDERYFNMRVGRKTRYVQLDLGAYFQDVIPPELISEEYDLASDEWRPQFRANPQVRKGEWRLFNAPSDAIEAALQIRFVRAIAAIALDETIDIPDVQVEPMSDLFADYVRAPETADAEFMALMQFMKLDPADYRPFLIQGLERARDYLASELGGKKAATAYQAAPVNSAMWGDSVRARPAPRAINSTGRPFALPIPREATIAAARRTQLNRAAAEQRPAEARGLSARTVDNGVIARDWDSECNQKLRKKAPARGGPKTKPKGRQASLNPVLFREAFGDWLVA